MEREAIVAVDVGTTSARAIPFAADDASPVAEAVSRAYPLLAPQPGYAEQDPDLVLAAALHVVAAAARAAREAGCAVIGLALGTAMHALVGLDSSDEPVTPLVTWGDARAGAQARRLRAEPLGLALHRRTGTPVHPMSPLLKLRWFAECEPATFATVRRWVGIKERLVHALTGAWVVDHGIASGTGLFDLAAADWDAEALAWAGIAPAQLPALVPTTHALPLSASGARRLGLPAGCPVVIGSADGPLASLGIGAIRPGAVACSIGTSGALRAAADAPRVDERGRVFCYALAPGRWVVGGATNNGGSVLDWVRAALAPDLDGGAPALLELAGCAAPGSGGLLFLPHLLGERAPRWTPGARGAYVGLTRAHGRPELLRAAVEGVCLQLALVLRSLQDADLAVREVRATGGFARSPLWRRILAGVLGHPIGFAASPEGSSLGAALLGLFALGRLDDLDRAVDLVAIAAVEEPEPAEAALYARLLPVFDALVNGLADASEALTELG